MQNTEQVITNPLKAIRAKCLDCSCWQVNEVRLCSHEKCALYPFRMGTNPYREPRKLTDEQKAAARESLAKARAKRKEAQEA